MATKIDIWQIANDGRLVKINSKLRDGARDEPNDLESWIVINPELIGNDFIIIGRQVKTISGELDLLGVDNYGNVLIIELKRDKLPREALAQAIDYASDVSSWDYEKLNQICMNYKNKSLEDYFYEVYNDNEEISFNSEQRIILVGFSIDESLHRMIEYLFNKYAMSINAIALKYVLTDSKEELIARTSIIEEELEKNVAINKRGIFKSDIPGNYDFADLKEKLNNYLKREKFTSIAIKKILFPLCLKNDFVTRDMIIDELNKQGLSQDKNIGTLMSNISQQIGNSRNDFLRQIIDYKYNPNKPWEKDNYSIKMEYKELISEILSQSNHVTQHGADALPIAGFN